MTADEQAEAILTETVNQIILEEGSSFTNEGNVEKEIVVQGGTLTLTNPNTDGTAVYTGNITVESGTVNVTGSNIETGSLTMNGGTINFSEGASVVLGEEDVLNLNGSKVIISVADASAIENGYNVVENLFGTTGTVTGAEGMDVTFTDAEGGKVAVPEPTTATLSLLALAARRRRR